MSNATQSAQAIRPAGNGFPGGREIAPVTVSDRVQSGLWGIPSDLGHQIEQQEREVARLRELVDGLFDGTKTWDEWDDSLSCPDRTNVARDGAAQELDDARTELFHLYRMTVGAA